MKNQITSDFQCQELNKAFKETRPHTSSSDHPSHSLAIDPDSNNIFREVNQISIPLDNLSIFKIHHELNDAVKIT